jgi:16S rRNA (cytosine1402-N4)-methyltransferase
MKHQNQNKNKNELHVPVLLNEVLEQLAPKAGDSYLDLTAGYGGHAARVIEMTGAPERAVLVDRDQNAVDVLTAAFGERSEITKSDFYSACEKLKQAGRQFDLILADLGVSSPHLNEANRGFAISSEGPLDMRMDTQQTRTAESVVNTYSEAELADLLRIYGDEPKARLIARLIVERRPLTTTSQLADIAKQAWPGHSRVHPATRTFQAVRIAVNDEIGQLERSLPLLIDLLAPGGRLGIISFHSLEDRVVKQFLKDHAGNRYDADLTLTTNRPITASPDELVFNPRSRSAKLRVAVKKNKNT